MTWKEVEPNKKACDSSYQRSLGKCTTPSHICTTPSHIYLKEIIFLIFRVKEGNCSHLNTKVINYMYKQMVPNNHFMNIHTPSKTS